MPMTIDGALRWWADERPDQPAICHSDERLTYRELDSWVGRVAGLFAARGCLIGDRVCLYATNSIGWWVAALATLRCGGIVCGIDPRMVPAEAHYLLGDYAPLILISEPGAAAATLGVGQLTSRDGAPVEVPITIAIADIDALRSGLSVDVDREIDPDAPAIIVTTSGSTARPKGVIYSNRSMMESSFALLQEEPFEVQPPRLLTVAPFSTAAGTVHLVHAVLHGGICYFENVFDPNRALATMIDEQISMFCAPPIFFERIMSLPEFEEANLSHLQISFTGGAMVSMKLLTNWAEKGVLVRQMYSQTEAGGWGTVNPRRFALSHPDRCGKGGPARDIAVIDSDGKFVPPEEQGQIVMRGPGIMLGYWNNPTATADTIVDGWLRTGDIGVLDDRGLLKFIDRAKDIIISGGLNISAAEVERVLLDFPGIIEAAVIAAPDERFGETVYAIVYGTSAISTPAIIDHCDRNLSRFKVPRYLAVSPDPMPRVPTGKIAKPLLRRRYLEEMPLPPRVR